MTLRLDLGLGFILILLDLFLRLADGSWYGLLFVDAFSSLLWLDMLPALKHWFDRLRALVTRVESEKGSNRVVAELACDFAPCFVTTMAIAMSRHGNVPKRFMGCAMRLASKLLNRLFKMMPGGTRDVPLWRYKGIKVPLHLDKFHPYGCEFQALIPKKLQNKVWG